MDKKQEAFLLELLNDFKIESLEHHQAIVNGLIELEKNPPSGDYEQLVETTFREVHSLKGAARAVNQAEIGRFCQSIEGIFHGLKQGKLSLTQDHFDALYQAVDVLGVMLKEIDVTNKRVSATMLNQHMKRLENLMLGKPAAHPMEIPKPPPFIPGSESPEIQSGLNKIPELTEERHSATDEPTDGIKRATSVKDSTKDTVRITTSKLQTLLREAEEFISVKTTLGYYIREIEKKQTREFNPLIREMEQFHHSLSRLVDDLLIDIKTTLLNPFSTLLDIVPKIVRDMGKEYKKEINLTIRGGEIEIDRRILEELKDPLIHLIRNCIDHGLENSQVRKSGGKDPNGLLDISVKQESGNRVLLAIRDDGAGIDRQKVIQAALKNGLITRERAGTLSDAEILGLIFRSGVSTSPFITDISGRGLGMAIVAEKISGLGGDVSVTSKPGRGTTFVITLPITISNFRGILVQVSNHSFIVPTISVEQAIRVTKEDIHTVESRSIILLNGESVPLLRLSDVLGIITHTPRKKEETPQPVMILQHARKRLALMVDQVNGEQEGMVKDMGPQLIHVRNITGVTILGGGQVIPILNVPELFESSMGIAYTDEVVSESGQQELSDGHQKYLLVAEDSITLRSLLRNILESSGYKVRTAVDGLEAFQFLQNDSFDLVVSDVEMPRLNGFDLTLRIRGDKVLSEIPVILVTALDSPADRQRGMECGANAYIVKGSFEQSNLLETIQRLI
ncbi:MAG TPA: response regulator [Bacteroidales bacterium]|nr:response regulator [Bacteroidales bacterium]